MDLLMVWIWCPSRAVWYAMYLLTIWICNGPLWGLNMQFPSWKFQYVVPLGCLNMMAFSTNLNTNTPLGIFICNGPFGNLNMNGPLCSLNMDEPFGGLNMVSLTAIWIWSVVLAVWIWYSVLNIWNGPHSSLCIQWLSC